MFGKPSSVFTCRACGNIVLESEKYCTACLDARNSAEQPTILSNTVITAERRELVVMFCDLVGSTELASKLDPEDMLDLIQNYRSTVNKFVDEYRGHTSQYYGDGVMVYFGWPIADEAGAENAIRAGLKIANAVSRQSRSEMRLNVRTGIASGLVVVGDVRQGVDGAQHTIIGEAPNIASRIQDHASPGSVVIDAQVRSRIGNLFDLDDLGALDVKGYADPVRIWRVERERAVRNRFAALRSGSSRQLLGRQAEIETLQTLWQSAKRGAGRAVLVCGEAGIGKSRLVAELAGNLGHDVGHTLSFYCAPHLSDSVLHPLIAHFEDAVGIDRRDGNDRTIETLAKLLDPEDRADGSVSLIASLLSIPVHTPDQPDLSPQARKRETFRLLLSWFRAQADLGTVCILFEDIHWADPTTLELLEQLVDRVHELPILLMLTVRDEMPPVWGETPGLVRVDLRSLDQTAATALAVSLFEGFGEIPSAVIDSIVAQSDGNPLFIEELTRSVVERGRHPSGPAKPASPVSVPTSLQASLMSRLDRLPDAKRLAQTAAVIGRDFARDILVDVAGRRESEVESGLRSLVGAEVLSRRVQGADVVYGFRHALLRDAAYESLLIVDRRAIHCRVVEVLRSRFPEIADQRPGMLGHHCAHAGLIAEAADYYRRAGNISARHAAMAETRSLLERGLQLTARLPESQDRTVLEAELKLSLGRVLLSTAGSADVEAGRILEQATNLCRQVPDKDRTTRSLWALWFNSAHRRELTTANTIARELLALAETWQDQPSRIVGHTMVGIARFWSGNFQEAEKNLRSATDLCRNDDDAGLDLAIVGRNLHAHAQMQFALALRCLGRHSESNEQGEAAQARALRAYHVPTQALVLAAKCRSDWMARAYDKTQRIATDLVELADRQGLPFYLALGLCHLGWLEVIRGRPDSGFRQLRDGYGALQTSDALIWRPYVYGMYAEAETVTGNYKHARVLLDNALEVSRRTGGAWFDAELHRLNGELELVRATPETSNAATHFDRAVATARRQSAWLWELRAMTSKAKELLRTGNSAGAYACLLPVRSRFPERTDARDVIAAAAVLDEAQRRMGRVSGNA